MALRTNGTLWIWGSDFFGSLGVGSGSTVTPVQVGTETWRSFSAGLQSTMAIKTDGTLWAWGENQLNELGTGISARILTAPTQVGTATTWRSVADGYRHALALQQDGTLWTWGLNSFGQLGTGTTADQPVPARLPALW